MKTFNLFLLASQGAPKNQSIQRHTSSTCMNTIMSTFPLKINEISLKLKKNLYKTEPPPKKCGYSDSKNISKIFKI